MPAAPQVPVITFYSPNKADQGLIEIWSQNTEAYQPLDLGAPHPNTRDYPGYKLGKQQNVPNNSDWIFRIWVKDQTNPVWWNWSEKFVSESNTHPVFIRQYREPRATYSPQTKGQPLKSVYKLTLTDSGTGYTPGTLPSLIFDNTGTGGSGATGHAVVNQNGTIAELVLDNGGDNYDSAPTFAVEDSPNGDTATGTASIQPATAVLVTEEAQPFPEDSEFFGLYLNVVRVYQTLPGPTLTTRTIGAPNLTPPEFRRQVVTNETKTRVATGEPDPTLSGTESLIRIEDQDAVQAEKTVITQEIDIDAEPQLGQDYDETYDVPLPYAKTLEVSGTSLGDNKKRITPVGDGTDVVIAFDPTTLEEVFSNYVLSFPSLTTLDIPDTLTGITIMKETSIGDGTSTDQVTSVSGSGSFAFTTPLRAQAQGSAAITGEVIPHMIPFNGIRRSVTNYMFFLPSPVTSADITAKLEDLTGLSVTNFADFKPGYITIVLIFKRMSAQASAGHTFHFSLNESGGMAMHSHSTEASKQIGMEVKTVRIPATLHGEITLKDEDGDPILLESSVSSDVEAHIAGFSGDVTIAPVDVEITADASMRILAEGLEATEGASALPDSGLLILGTNARPYKYGWVMVQAEVIDASTL